MSMSSSNPALQPVQSSRAWLRRSLAFLALLFIVGCEYLPERSASTMTTDDAPLSVAVAEALMASPETTQLQLIITNPTEGKVRLLGNVNSDGQRVAAEQIAASVDGVRSVINTLYLR